MTYFSIHNDAFLKRVFNRKLRKGLARIQCSMACMSFTDKIQFVVDRLSDMRFNVARMILEYWEDTNEVVALLERFQIRNYEVVREYRMGSVTPGIINIYFSKSFDSSFLKVFITKHFGYESAKKRAWDVWPLLAIDTDTQIVAIKLFSNSEFHEFVYLKHQEINDRIK